MTPLLIVSASIILLVILITLIKLDAFISFIIISIAAGFALGMSPSAIITAVETGIGGTLGSLVMVIGFGAMLGKMVADSGAAQRISSTLIRIFGIKYIQWALVITGFVVGIPMFYNVGFVVLVPIVFTVASSTGLPLLYIGIPLLASLSVTHGLLPPHPSPAAITLMFEANMGKTLVYGIIVAIPAIIIAGPIFSRFVKNLNASPLKDFVNPEELTEKEMPGLAISLVTALLPVVIILLSTIIDYLIPKGSIFEEINNFIGNPSIALLFSVLFSIYILGIKRGLKMKEIMDANSRAFLSITMILLIIAGAGIFKQILVDSGVGEYIAELLSKSSLSPLLLAWLIAAAIRVSVGSATVAGLTAAGIVLPLIGAANTSPELMVLAIGSGSLVLSHVNDSGFWLYKEYFNLSVKDTFLSWTIMETLVGVIGIIGVLIIDIFI